MALDKRHFHSKPAYFLLRCQKQPAWKWSRGRMWENLLPVYLRCAGNGWEWRGTAQARDPQAFWTRCTPSFIPLRSARDEFCISTLPYVDYTAIWVTALRTRKYPKVCLQVGQLFRRLLQLEEVICFLFLTLVLSLFFSGAPCFSLQLS